MPVATSSCKIKFEQTPFWLEYRKCSPDLQRDVACTESSLYVRAVGDRSAQRGEGILQATLEQLAVVGFRALSIEEVAARAGVNKTTVYRRWPTKVSLVRAAMESLAESSLVQPDTGSLRGDLLAICRTFTARVSSLEGQSVFRVMALESTEPEFQVVGETFKRAYEAMVTEVLATSLARSEIDTLPDFRLVTILLVGPLHLRLFANNERVDEAFIERLVDAILYGLLPRKTPKPTRRASLAVTSPSHGGRRNR